MLNFELKAEKKTPVATIAIAKEGHSTEMACCENGILSTGIAIIAPG